MNLILSNNRTINTASGNITIEGVISGSGFGITKQGNSTLTLSGANTYTGLTDIQAGTLTLGDNDVFADASTLKISGGILSLLTYNDTVAGVQLTGGSITSSSGVLTSTAAFDLQNGSVNAILGGIAGLNKTTGSTVTLSGVNTYTGLTDVLAGTLTLGANNVFANSSTLKVSGGILSLATFTDTVAGVQLTSGSITSSSGVLTSTTVFDLQTGTVSAILGGSVGLNKTTSGTVNLSGENTYEGQTNVNGGKLTVDSTGAINFTTQVSIGAGEFNYNSGTTLTKTVTFSLSGGTLSGTGTIQNGFTVTSGNTYSAGAVGATGTQTLSGGATFSSGSIFHWDLDVTGDTSANHDQVTASSLAGLGGAAQFSVVLGSGDLYTAPFWDSARNWTSTEIFGTNANLSSIFSISSTAPSNEGSFSFTDVSGGTRNQLTWTPIPEPTSALGGLLLAAGLLRRKRCLPSA